MTQSARPLWASAASELETRGYKVYQPGGLMRSPKFPSRKGKQRRAPISRRTIRHSAAIRPSFKIGRTRNCRFIIPVRSMPVPIIAQSSINPIALQRLPLLCIMITTADNKRTNIPGSVRKLTTQKGRSNTHYYSSSPFIRIFRLNGCQMVKYPG